MYNKQTPPSRTLYRSTTGVFVGVRITGWTWVRYAARLLAYAMQAGSHMRKERR